MNDNTLENLQSQLEKINKSTIAIDDIARLENKCLEQWMLDDNFINTFKLLLPKLNGDKLRLPLSFSEMECAQDYVRRKHKDIFALIAQHQEKSKNGLNPISNKNFKKIPIIVSKKSFLYKSHLDSDYKKRIAQECQDYIVLETTAETALLFKCLPAFNNDSDIYGGYTADKALILGIDLAGKEQEVCFLHETLGYPISCCIDTNELLSYMYLSTRKLHLFSEACSMTAFVQQCISNLNKIKNKVQYQYNPIHNLALNHHKRATAKNDRRDAAAIYSAGSTPIALLRTSRVSDEYCAQGKVISTTLHCLEAQYHDIVNNIKNSVYETFGQKVDPQAPLEDITNIVTSLVLSRCTKDFAQEYIIGALKRTNDISLVHNIASVCNELGYMTDEIQALKDEAYRRIKKKNKEQIAIDNNDTEALLADAIENINNLCKSDNYSAHTVNLNCTKTSKGHECLDSTNKSNIFNDDLINHLAPTEGNTEQEMRSKMYLTLAMSIFNMLQLALITQSQIISLKQQIKAVVVPSNRSMHAARAIPSIGALQAFELVISVGNINDFADASQLLRYLGIVPEIKNTGHRDKKGHRLSRLGRKELKRRLYLGQISVAIAGPIRRSDSDVHIWKNIATAVRKYYGMMKSNTHYMPINEACTEKMNSSVKHIFSKSKNLYDENIIREEKAGLNKSDNMMLNMLNFTSKLLDVRDYHDNIDDDLKEQDSVYTELVMPSMLGHSRRAYISPKLKVNLFADRITHSLLPDYAEIMTSFNTLVKDKETALSLYGNNPFSLLGIIKDAMCTASFVHDQVCNKNNGSLLELDKLSAEEKAANLINLYEHIAMNREQKKLDTALKFLSLSSGDRSKRRQSRLDLLEKAKNLRAAAEITEKEIQNKKSA